MLRFDELTPPMIASIFGNCKQRLIDVRQLLGCGLDNKEVIRLLDERERRSKMAFIESGEHMAPVRGTLVDLYNSLFITDEEEAIAIRQREKLSAPQLKVVDKIMTIIPIGKMAGDSEACANCPCAAEITPEECERLRKESWR